MERQQRAEAIARLESIAGDNLTDDQRAIVAELAQSLTTELAPVAETIQLTRSSDGEHRQDGVSDGSDG